MFLTITFILLSLVVLNFGLLYFSCNNTQKETAKIKETRVINKPITTQESPVQLAPTGS